MWYKQLSAFWLPSPPSAALLEATLLTAPHQPPAGLDWFAEGFVPPTPFSGDLVFNTDDRLDTPFAVIQKQEEHFEVKVN